MTRLRGMGVCLVFCGVEFGLQGFASGFGVWVIVRGMGLILCGTMVNARHPIASNPININRRQSKPLTVPRP